MFSSRNIHFAILGIILGGASGYVLAFYQAQSVLPRAPVSATSTSSTMPANHPDVSNEKMVELFNQALQKSPNDTELMSRYAAYLYENSKFPESLEWFEKVLALKPDDVNARADMATALWKMGERDKALAEYEKAAKGDPKNILLLHTLFLVQTTTKNVKSAANTLKQIEALDPKYTSLPDLKKQLEEASKASN